MEPQSTSVSRKGSPPIALFIILALVVAGGVGWYFYTRGGVPEAKPPVLTDEARAYVRAGSLKLADVAMGAKESFAKQTLVEITGNITNGGNREVKLIEITCVFQDPYGQVILRERRPIVRERGGGLKPGETKPFRLAFDNLPDNWNQALPQLVIAQIVFG